MRRIRVVFGLTVLVFFSFLMMYYIPAETGESRNIFKKELIESNQLTSEEFYKKIIEGSVLLIDVRSPGELVSGKIEGAKNINLYDYEFSSVLDSIDSNKTILLYCSSGSRSKEALKIFDKKGFKMVFELDGGIREWKHNGYPVITE